MHDDLILLVPDCDRPKKVNVRVAKGRERRMLRTGSDDFTSALEMMFSALSAPIRPQVYILTSSSGKKLCCGSYLKCDKEWKKRPNKTIFLYRIEGKIAWLMAASFGEGRVSADLFNNGVRVTSVGG